MRGKGCIMLTPMFFLVLALAVDLSEVRANSSLQSVAASGSPATANSASPAPALELMGRWHRGPVYSSSVSGDHLYFGTGGGIRVLRIKHATGQNTSWQEVASIATSGIVRDLAAFENYLYVADDSGALRIIDISAPEKPR